ncbi:SdpI family protein [Paenibacillus qinlingensis]|uniref:Membrane protein n=1 Tax=Paenibacillus qinlingensis TaxID=1837343 RepID=A0ABU1NX46_9BACL|nr:SdpI family protein [Paenibacillus qinlingensis]MDR6552054.1 putative membrane protein [Paenibacillus qinlingensis]
MKKWREILLFVISLSPVLGGLILYNRLPDTMASHFGVNNEVNGTMSKGMSLFMLVLLGLLPLFMRIMRAIDPKKANFEKFPAAYEVTRFGVSILLAIVGWGIIFFNLGYNLDFKKMTMILLGLLFAVMGNFLTQVKPNYTFGIRTPWTLANEEIWRKTHRLGGPLMMVGGVISLIAAFLTSSIAIFIFIAAIVISSCIPILYSYVIFTRLSK